MNLHSALDSLVAAFLREHPDHLPSTTTVLELIEWSARRNFESAKAAADAAGGAGRCLGCGVFLSAIRLQMRLDRCPQCDGHGGRRRRS